MDHNVQVKQKCTLLFIRFLLDCCCCCCCGCLVFFSRRIVNSHIRSLWILHTNFFHFDFGVDRSVILNTKHSQCRYIYSSNCRCVLRCFFLLLVLFLLLETWKYLNVNTMICGWQNDEIEMTNRKTIARTVIAFGSFSKQIWTDIMTKLVG